MIKTLHKSEQYPYNRRLDITVLRFNSHHRGISIDDIASQEELTEGPLPYSALYFPGVVQYRTRPKHAVVFSDYRTEILNDISIVFSRESPVAL
jgi:hypothetical protein